MKINELEAIKLVYEFEVPRNDALAVRRSSSHPMEVLVVKITASNGMIGCGESICYGGADAVASTVERVLSPILIGEDSSNIVGLWDKMYYSTFRLGRRGIVVAAMSGIDIALWDLLGKELGTPIYRLLGSSKKPLRGYVTGGYYGGANNLEDEVGTYVKAGFETQN